MPIGDIALCRLPAIASEKSVEERCGFIRDADDLVCRLTIKLEIESDRVIYVWRNRDQTEGDVLRSSSISFPSNQDIE